MGRVQLGLGTRYVQGGHAHVVRQFLTDGRLLVENQTMGGHAVLARGDLDAAWGRGDITFEVQV